MTNILKRIKDGWSYVNTPTTTEDTLEKARNNVGLYTGPEVEAEAERLAKKSNTSKDMLKLIPAATLTALLGSSSKVASLFEAPSKAKTFAGVLARTGVQAGMLKEAGDVGGKIIDNTTTRLKGEEVKPEDKVSFTEAAFALPFGLGAAKTLATDAKIAENATKAATAVMDKARNAVYNNVMPYSYNKTYLKDGTKLNEGINALKEFINPTKGWKTPETTKWEEYVHKSGMNGSFYPVPENVGIGARKEIYQRYLGLRPESKYYKYTGDGKWSYNMDEITPESKQAFVESILQQKGGTRTTKALENPNSIVTADYLGTAGGNVNGNVVKNADGTYSAIYKDIWDINPFKEPGRSLDIMPKWMQNVFYKTAPDARWGTKVVDIKPLGKLLGKFELSTLTGGRPVEVETTFPVNIVNRGQLLRSENPRHAPSLKKYAEMAADPYLDFVDDDYSYQSYLNLVKKYEHDPEIIARWKAHLNQASKNKRTYHEEPLLSKYPYIIKK